MRTLIRLSVAIFLFVVSSTCCFAEHVLVDVNKEQVKEWNVVIKSRKNGNAQIWITLELETKGKWESFQRVDLAVKSEGQLLAFAPLEVTNPTSDSISTVCYVHPSMLKDSKIHVSVNAKGTIGYRFKLSDFMEAEEISGGAPRKTSAETE